MKKIATLILIAIMIFTLSVATYAVDDTDLNVINISEMADGATLNISEM